jgi:hypothetical protein
MTSVRPFKILGIQQMAIGGLDKERLRALWVDQARSRDGDGQFRQRA